MLLESLKSEVQSLKLTNLYSAQELCQNILKKKDHQLSKLEVTVQYNKQCSVLVRNVAYFGKCTDDIFRTL